jgi:transposase
MQYIQGTNRSQAVVFTTCLDDIIEQQNEVRLIDLFVNSINLTDFSFATMLPKEGRPPYHPKSLLKLFIYGYLNGIRSSRTLEKECKRNIELMWLMQQLAPDHNTISNFRRDNQKAIRQVFKYTVSIAKNFELIGGTLIAGDSTKLRAQNSKKNNFNEKKIEQHLQYIDKKLDEYEKALATADGDTNKQIIEQHITTQKQRKAKYKSYQQQLQQTGNTQISTSDADSRQMITRNNITEVAYNIQTTVDAKHYIPIDYKVTNTNDSKAMGNMVRRAQTILNNKNITVLFDKGYHTGSELQMAQQHGAHTLVAVPGVASFAPNENYNFDKFIYNNEQDTYTCPQQQTLSTNGNWYQKSKQRYIYFVKHYKTNKCLSCPALALCTTNKKGRLIERSEYQSYIEQNQINIAQQPLVYKKRQAIIEHNYGIIKRQWGYYYISTKQGIKRASADVGFMFTAYNLRRLFNLIDPKMLTNYLKKFVLYFLRLFTTIKLILSQNVTTQFFYNKHFVKI